VNFRPGSSTSKEASLEGSAHDFDRSIKGRLTLAVIFTAIIFFAELFGGYIFNSLALLSDAAHVFMDVLALSMSLFAIYISGLPPTEKRTFGLHRVEVLVSFLNGMTLLFVSLFIFYKAYTRFLDPQEVESVGMLAIAVVGLVVNAVVALWLRGHAKHDLNVKSAFFHVIGDAVASAGVIVAGIIIYFTGWYRVDSIISALIGMIIVGGAVRIIEESTHILLEGVPRDIDLNEVLESMKSLEGVTGIHSLHIWSICHNIYALGAHVDIDPAHRANQGEILSTINERLAENYHIFYTTLQVECASCESGDVLRNIAHKERKHLH
jgi:cobalt-zinc-cadmium efflux system protein